MSALEIDNLITDRDVAKIFRVARSTVWDWSDKGLIPKPVVQRHKFTRWSQQQVQAAIESLKQAERTEAAS